MIFKKRAGFYLIIFLYGHLRAWGENVGTTFQPDFMNINEFLEGVRKLPEYSKAKIQEEIKKEELEAAI